MSTSTTQLYRDSKGNVVNSSGKIVMTASAIANMSAESQKNLKNNLPLYKASSNTSSSTTTQKSTTSTKTSTATQPKTINESGDPYFMGDYSIVQYDGEPWYIDKNTKTLRPYKSLAAFNNLYDFNVEDLPVLSFNALLDGGTLDGYSVLGTEYAIDNSGNFKQYDKANLQARYNKSIDTGLEKNSYMALDGFIGLLSSEESGISSSVLKKVTNDSERIAKYINALAYGGYTLSDIYRDIAKDDLIKSGSSEYKNIESISTIMTRDEYQTTKEGKKAYSDPLISPPSQLAGVDSSTINLPIWSIPSEAFKTLIPMMDYDSEEFQDAMDEIESAYHDILLQQLSASTEQEKALADYNYSQFKEEIAKKYNIILSNNAIAAWNQVKGIREQFAGRGLSGSGLQDESIDDYLKTVRMQDQQSREEKLTQEEAQQANYYLKYATQEEIKKLVEENPEFAKKIGLIPSEDIKSALSFEALRAKYPEEVSDEEIMDYISSVIDENGNYRSELYQNYATKALGIKQEKQTYQQGQVLQNYLNEEEEKYAEYTTPDSPFLRQADTTEETGKVSDYTLPKFESVSGKNTTSDISSNKSTTTPTTSTSGTYYLKDPSGKMIPVTKEQADSYSAGANSLAAGYSIIKPTTTTSPTTTTTTKPKTTTTTKPTTTTTKTTSTLKSLPTGTVAVAAQKNLNEEQKALARKLGYNI